MTWHAALVWSIVRALIVATVSLPIALQVWHSLNAARSKKWSRILVAAAVLPLLIPALLTGFTYRLTAATLIHSAGASEVLYGGLLLTRAVALQVIAFAVLSSSSVSTDELNSWRLLRHRSRQWWRTWLSLLVAGPWRSSLVAWLGAVLITFQEFEIAALLQIDRHPIAFSVWLFDAHANGEPLSRSLWLAAPAVVFQVCLIVPALIVWMRGQPVATVTRSSEPELRLLRFRGSVLTGMVFVSVGVAFTFVSPVARHTAQCLVGLKTLITDGTVSRYLIQIVQTLSVAVVASVCAVVGISLVRRTRLRSLLILCLLPGLCGPLVMSLVLLSAFQVPPLRAVYDTPVPLIVALTLLLLPAATLLKALLAVRSSPPADHTAILLTSACDQRSLQAADLLWVLRQRRQLIVVAVLTHLAFWDVTTASILRPIRFGHIVTRLYGEMHFSRGESLIAISTLALIVPVALILMVSLIWRVSVRRRARGRI